MILQSLKEYYDRKSELPRYGLEEKEIPYIVVLDKYGSLVGLESTYEDEGRGKSKRAKRFLVPKSIKRSAQIDSNTLWDNCEYALGIKIKSKHEDVIKMHETFIKTVDSLGDLDDEGLKALKLFLKKTDKETLLKKKDEQVFEDLKKDKNPIVTFRLQDRDKIISESQTVMNIIKSTSNSDIKTDKDRSHCLISGELDNIERIHHNIKGVWGAQSSGGNIVSFNKPAYISYGKEQGHNAPCGKKAVFAYTTALNHLLDKDSSQRMQVGDASTVFWGAKESEFENKFALFFGMPTKENPDAGTMAVKALYESIKKGAFNNDEGKQDFYVLGLSPNASRIVIRFFIKDTIKGMSENIYKHFKDLEIVCPSFEKSNFLPLFSLLVSTAVNEKSENIAPHLEGEFMMSILKGLLYPQTLLQYAINRIKAEQKITYPRAALIKAYLNRFSRYKKQKEEITVSLDKTNTNIGYVLGRLFSTLEKLQSEAQGDINSTIMRYYGSASSVPIAVFANLMRLQQHHRDKLSKDKAGRSIYFEKLIGEITDKININNNITYPTHLSLTNQGNFSIGYYHQRQDFFPKNDDKTDQSEKQNKENNNV
jgi:CRISPR-associated protein Csd1